VSETGKPKDPTPGASGRLRTVKVPAPFAPVFTAAQDYVSRYFRDRVEDPEKGTISISGERYILVRAASMSVEFFDLVRSLYQDKGAEEARTVASNLLFDTAHAIGKADARIFREKMGVTDPIERLSAGPVHFAYAGWAFVDILPESRPSPDEEYFLVYDHPFSFESHAWLSHGRTSPAPVCIMNAGYSSGWCEESFGVPLVAVETECLASGGERCRFIMAPPSRIEEHLARFWRGAGEAETPRRPATVSVPEFFHRKRLEDDLRRHQQSLEDRVRERTADLEAANDRLRAEVAERKAAEEALRASEDRFARAFRLSPASITITSLDDGRFLDVNDSFVRFIGYSREILIGRSSVELGLWSDPAARDRRRESVRAGGRVSEVEVSVVTASGERRQVLLSAEVIDLSGRRCLLSLLQDVTGRRRTEETLRLAQRMDSLGVLAGGIAHDFNNLLAVMLGHNALVLTRLAEGSVEHQHVLKAMAAAERAAVLTKQMLAYSGRGHFEIRPTDLNELVRQNVSLLGAALPKNVTLTGRCDETIPPIAADAGQLQQVVMNLIMNASEAIGERTGRVAMRTGVRDVAAGDLSVRSPTGEPLAPGRYVVLEATDDGAGMDEALLSRIFEPFFTTKSTGRGLGLAATQGIVRGHRGGLRVESAPGAGTTFTLLFPASQEVSDERRAEASASPRELVLVVDDEEAVREVIHSVLEVAGFDTLIAKDGNTAVELFRANGAEIGLVLLDLSMPGLSGEQTFEELRRMDPTVRVLLSSGYSEAEATRRFVGRGLAGFIQKPYRPEQLVDAVRRALRE
jgi:two-component system cell cycle sensor histidine kinase/response regulator CckA